MESHPPQTVFITGASSGIGRMVAERLVQEGFDVWGSARSISRLPEWDGFHAVELDLCDPASIEHAVIQVEEESGGIDVLINNAGNGIFGPVVKFSQAELDSQFQTLVSGPLTVSQILLPRMQERGQGQVINVSSIGAQFPIPFMGPYSAFKATLSMLTDALSVECAGRGIQFVDLRPGDIRTPFNQAAAKVEAELGEDWQQRCDDAWEVIEKELEQGPTADVVAEKMIALIRSQSSGRHTVGNFFQTCMAPLGERLLPRKIILKALASYYKLS
ncbi:MAG: SDR family NAD(P)-dependent oxidoreductase [Verrucomicrobiota bacterium]